LKYLYLLICLLSINSLAEEADWPTTVTEAVNVLLETMDDDAKQKIRETAKDALIQYHHGWGTSIRNSFGLWGNNLKLIDSACGKPCHPDDASMKIIEAVWAQLTENSGKTN